MLNPLSYHVTMRKLTNPRKGKHLASFDELAWALTFAHNRRRDYRTGNEIVVWVGDDAARPAEWSIKMSTTCEGV